MRSKAKLCNGSRRSNRRNANVTPVKTNAHEALLDSPPRTFFFYANRELDL